MLEIIFIIALVSLVIGSISDLKTYEIPDWLNFSLIAVGVGVNAIYSLSTQNYIYIIECLVGLAFSVALAYLMFYTGQWGGGDSKMIMGLGAIIGLPFKITYMSFLSYFYINIAFIGALYGFIWIISYLLFNLKKVFKRTKLKLKKTKLVRYIVYGFTIISIALVYFMPESAIDPIFKYFAYSMIFFIFSTFFIWVVVKSIEEVCMIKKVAPEKLTEGDWIVKDIKIDGKRICGPKDLGIERKQIDQLIKFKKQKKITYVTIKNGIPFVPSFLFAFVYTIIFNNIIFLSMIV